MFDLDAGIPWATWCLGNFDLEENASVDSLNAWKPRTDMSKRGLDAEQGRLLVGQGSGSGYGWPRSDQVGRQLEEGSALDHRRSRLGCRGICLGCCRFVLEHRQHGLTFGG